MPWDPVRDLLSMQERLESLFGHSHPGWVPPVDLVEQDDRYLVAMELPGLTRADVQIEFSDQVLTVTGTRPPSAGSERYQQLERGQGPFTRSFRFTASVTTSDISAEITDGVLVITVPKTSVDRRRIDVSGS